MLVKVLIVYSILFILFHKLNIFNYIHKYLYGKLYVKDKLDISALLYAPYDFSNIRNIILSFLATPYGLWIISLSLLVILFGYISHTWFIIFSLIVYILLVIGYYIVFINEKSIYIYYVSRLIMLLIPFIRLSLNIGSTKEAVKIYGEQVGPTFILLALLILIEYTITYNYKPDLGEYTVKNINDYNRIYNPKWIFITFIIPIYIMIYILLRSINLTNTVVISFTLMFLFLLFSYLIQI